MYIKGSKLFNFRNYSELNIKFSKNFNVIYGENAQGKTNILESVFLCSSGRSHRTSKDYELIKFGLTSYYVKVDYIKQNMDSSVEVIYSKDEKKSIKINDVNVKKIGDLMGNLDTVLLSPENLVLVKEGPSERRRFLDITISQLKPSYFFDLQQYVKVLHQRNTLLKDIQRKSSLSDTLDIWNKNLAYLGARIMNVRAHFLKRIAAYAEKNHNKLTREKEKLLIKYDPSIRFDDKCGVKEIEDLFLKELERCASREIASGVTLSGPQRDDYDLFLNTLNLKLYGSQGQQRTAVLSIKLSEIDIIKEETGEYPVLLLDDVMSELDNNRQEYLMNNLDNIQTFITCTDSSFFENSEGRDINYYKIQEGMIVG